MEDYTKGIILGMLVTSAIWILGFISLENRLHSDAINAGCAKYNATTGDFEYTIKDK